MIVPLIIGFSVNGWNVYRALASHGLRIVVLDNDPESIFWKCRGPELRRVDALSGPVLLEALQALAADGREYLLISAIEETVAYLSEERARIPANIRLDFPSRETVRMLLDKRLFYGAATQIGCAIQPMFFFEKDWTVSGGMERVGFPCVVKTRAKMYLPGLKKAYRINNAFELGETAKELSKIPGLKPDDLLIQQWVPGGDGNVYFCMQYYTEFSEPLISFVGRKIRQWRPQVGGTASAVAVENDRILTESTRFFKSIGMRGLCSMEFKLSPDDGEFYMIEPTACRADYQEGVAVANGYNVPYAMYSSVAGLSYEPKPAARPVLWVHAAPDYLSAMHYRAAGQLTIREWLGSLQGPKSYAIFTPSAPGPFLETLRRAAARKARRLLKWN